MRGRRWLWGPAAQTLRKGRDSGARKCAERRSRRRSRRQDPGQGKNSLIRRRQRMAEEQWIGALNSPFIFVLIAFLFPPPVLLPPPSPMVDESLPASSPSAPRPRLQRTSGTVRGRSSPTPASNGDPPSDGRPPTKRARKAINCEPCRNSKLKCDRSVKSQSSCLFLLSAFQKSPMFVLCASRSVLRPYMRIPSSSFLVCRDLCYVLSGCPRVRRQ